MPHYKGGNIITDVIQAFRGPRKNASPIIRKLIEEKGNKQIRTIYICRAPIIRAVDSALNFISLGKWSEAKSKYGYGDLFHLYLIITFDDKKPFYIEKNHVVEISFENKGNKNEVCKWVPLNGKHITLSEFLGNAEKEVGPKIWLYDAADNNCQYFVDNLLKANGLLTPDLHNFIMQDTKSIIEHLPSYVKKVINTATDLAARADILKVGKGKLRYSSNLR